jgi:hypothetical protein
MAKFFDSFGIGFVRDFNFDAFNKACNKDPPTYDELVIDYDAIASELFQISQVWARKDLIEEVMKSLARHHG